METKSKIYKLMSHLNYLKWGLAVKGLLVGLAAGLLAVLYRFAIEYGTELSQNIYKYIKQNPVMIVLWLLVIAGIGTFIGWLVKLEPMASGSGIPQVEGVLLFGFKMKWVPILAVRYIGGTLCSFFGLSLGREGPSIQIGAAGGQAVAKRLSKSRLEENYLITGGAAAGLSAAFNAPLSGMVFALEEVHRSFSPLILLSATTASLTADFVSKTFFGLRPVLDFTTVPQLPLSLYAWLLPLGVCSGLVGSFINKTLLYLIQVYSKIPELLRPVLALLVALPCGLFLPQVLGGGQGLIKLSESATGGILFLCLLFAVKLLFTSTSFGSGVPGGIFLPILAAGALSGSIFGLIAVRFGLPVQYIPDFAVCAMAGALSSSVKAPVTSILLTVEMAGTLVHMLPVAACSFIALLLSDILKVQPIYEALLERFAESKGKTLPMQEKGGLHEIPVEFGSYAAEKAVSEINWPQGLLIVGIRRGMKEIIPQGNTKILSGDYLIVLASEDCDAAIKASLTDYCYAKNG